MKNGLYILIVAAFTVILNAFSFNTNGNGTIRPDYSLENKMKGTIYPENEDLVRKILYTQRYIINATIVYNDTKKSLPLECQN